MRSFTLMLQNPRAGLATDLLLGTRRDGDALLIWMNFEFVRKYGDKEPNEYW